MPTVQTNGIRTYYEEYGEGPPLVFLHGAYSDHRLWAEQARQLASDYRVIVYDLRGHGRTGGSETTSYTMGLYADDLDALITALKLDRPAICGLSMGGMVAQTHAAENPDTIAALCTLGAVTPEILTRGEWLDRRVVPKLIDTVSTVVDRERVIAVLRWINERRYEEGASGDLEKLVRIQQAHAEEFPEVTETESEKIGELLTTYPAVTIEHSAITVPSLLMYAEREPNSVARHAKYMANTISDAEACQIPNAGHNSHVDNPEFVIDSLRAFLTGITEHGHW
ncbi:alpha/beta fold hydrolase [Haladaptatus sp. NG-SE-30]